MKELNTCHNCDRKILNTIHQKCMYCGWKLPVEQQFSDQQIKEFKAQMTKDKDEQKANIKLKHGQSSPDTWLDIPSDSSGSDSSC